MEENMLMRIALNVPAALWGGGVLPSGRPAA